MANQVSSFAGAFFAMLYYLPIYFQSVDGVSASESGIRNIPLVLGVCTSCTISTLICPRLMNSAIFTVVSGGLITKYGFYVPFLLAGSSLATIGAGLIYTLDIGSPSSHWIGYQALAGIGIGLSIQVPIIANQAFVSMSDISSITAITLCKYPTLISSSYILKTRRLIRLTSLPNHWRGILRRRRPNRIHQPAPCTSPSHRSHRQPLPGRSNRRDRVAGCLF